MKQLLPYVFIIAVVISKPVFSRELDCSSLLDQQPKNAENFNLDSFYERLETLEKKYFYLLEKLNSKFSNNVDINKNLESLIKTIEVQIGVVETIQESLLRNELILDDDIKSLEDEQYNIYELFQNQDLQKNRVTVSTNIQMSLHLDTIIESPELARSEIPYQVDMNGKEITSVVISQSLIKEIFNDLSKRRTVSRSLKKIKKGVFGSTYSGDGIIKMVHDSQIVEIRASGRDGNFRFFGYIDNSQLFLVHYTLSSDHSGASTQKHADKVSKIRFYRNK